MGSSWGVGGGEERWEKSFSCGFHVQNWRTFPWAIRRGGHDKEFSHYSISEIKD